MDDESGSRGPDPASRLALLQARLSAANAQLARFSATRERLVSTGVNPDAAYTSLLDRRDSALRTLRSHPAAEQLGRGGLALDRPDRLLQLPIAQAIWWKDMIPFGTCGYVQGGNPTGGFSTAPGVPLATGAIESLAPSVLGEAVFEGTLAVGPDEVPPSQYDPSINYFWLRNWQFLLPFPAPGSLGTLAYSFSVSAFVTVFLDSGPAQLSCFASVGETANLLLGQGLQATTDVGWPIIADLTQPAPLYNGHYGQFEGTISVHRSFGVEGGRTPGVVITLGIIVGTAMQAGVRLGSFGECTLQFSAGGVPGRVAYSLSPEFIARLIETPA